MIHELKAIFEQVDSEILSEDILKEISTLVESSINTKVEERVQLELDNALKLQLEKFKKVSEKATQTIDEDHTNKIKHVVKVLTEKHNQELLTIKEAHDKILKETAIKHKDTLIESVNDFLDLYVEKALPRQQIAEAAKNKFALKTMEEARKILGVDEKFINKNIKEGILDGKRQLDAAIKENAELKKARLIEESQNILARKTKNLPVNVAKFVNSRLAGKSPEFIKENFDYVVDMYKRSEKKERRSALINEGKNLNVDRSRVADEFSKQTYIIEQTNNTIQNSPMDMYIAGLEYRK